MPSATSPAFAAPPTPAYAGLLDDFSLRFEDNCISDVPTLNRRLITAVLLGDPLLMNDGYVIMSGALRNAIITPKQSPFSDLVECGFVKVLTRNLADLRRLARDMADGAIGDANQLITSDFYVNTYQPSLSTLMDRLQKNEEAQSFVRWPADLDLSGMFNKTATAAYDAMKNRDTFPSDDLDRFYDEFQSGELHRRTEWEKVSRKLSDDGHIPANLHRPLMQAASEAYHYAWGCALTEPGQPVRVLTQAPRYLAIDTEVGADQLQGHAQDHQISVQLPLFDDAYKKIGDNWNQASRGGQG